MIKIGLIDRWLDNWHTNYYPGFLREAARSCGFDAEIVYAWAESDAPGGMTSEAWCEKNGVTLLRQQAELIARCDALMVMCADDVFPHEALAQQALMSGKRVYCDKTFAPDTAAAMRMFSLAAQHGTQVFSCSAQRFCPDLTRYMEDAEMAGSRAAFAATTGPGEIRNYSVHQLEMLERVMGTGCRDCIAFPVNGSVTVVFRYDGGRRATFVQSPNASFSMTVSDAYSNWDAPNKPRNRAIAVGDYYMPFMGELLTFFAGGALPVRPEDTLEIVSMQEGARRAIRTPETIVRLPEYSV